MKKQGSVKIAIGFVLAVAILFGGNYLYTQWSVGSLKFAEVTPGDVNIVGVDAGAGYRVIVANQMAQLVEASDQFGAREDQNSGATSGAIKKRIPVREMLDSLKGDEKALSQFVMIMNNMAENDDWPAVRVIWKAEELRRALDGDKVSEAKLIKDLNVKLDGSPLKTLRFESLENGIMVETPVQVKVSVGGVPKVLTARVLEPYKPRLLKSVEQSYAGKSANVDQNAQSGYYKLEAERVAADPKLRENVRKSLEGLISPGPAKERAVAPERILGSARTVVNESYITKASYRGYESTRGKMFDITVDLTNEGRLRLWQYSRNRKGSQLLLCANGVAIAAPRISTELSQGELTITQMQNEGLVRDAVNLLNERHGRTAEK